MAKVTARIKSKGKDFEIHVDLDEALKVRDGKGDVASALDSPVIFTDLKKGDKAKEKDLMECFGTTDVYEVATRIIQKGEVQKTQEFRDEAREQKIKQVVTLIVKNAVDQNGRPYTEERIRRAIEEAHYSFDNKPAEQQMPEVLHKLKTVIPIKIEIKRIKMRIPARYTGTVYGLLKE